MIKQQVADNLKEASAATVKEISGLYDLGCFRRWPRFKSKNIINARWVTIWKMIEGTVGVKCRLAVRGFNDTFHDLDIYVGTTSRIGQRFANAIAAENLEFTLFSFDVSQAFAKGMTFEELSALSGQYIRKVEFDVPKADRMYTAIAIFQGF